MGEVGNKRPPKEHQFKKGQSGNPKGREVGTRNRATVVTELLETIVDLKGAFPQTSSVLGSLGLETKGDLESLMTMRQIVEALNTGDTAAYRALMDSRYGMPKQKVEGEIATTVTIRKEIVRR